MVDSRGIIASRRDGLWGGLSSAVRPVNSPLVRVSAWPGRADVGLSGTAKPNTAVIPHLTFGRCDPATDIVRWSVHLGNVGSDMDRLYTPAERVRHIEQDGLFGTWDWDFVSGAITWSDGSFRLLGFEPGSVSPSYKQFLESMHPEDRFGYE